MKLLALGVVTLIFLATVTSLVALQKPFMPDFVKVQIETDSEHSTYDDIILEHLRFIARESELWESLRTRTKRVRLPASVYFQQCETSYESYHHFLTWLNDTKPDIRPVELGNGSYSFEMRNKADHFRYSPNRPVSGVTLVDAAVYCQLAGGRLPNLEEWQAAAVGSDRRLFPWGDEFEERPWSTKAKAGYQDVACGRYQETSTPPLDPSEPDSVIHDLATGVSEWTMGSWFDGGSKPALAGGSQYKPAAKFFALGTTFSILEPTAHDRFSGFRCVFDDPELNIPWPSAPKLVELPAGEYVVGPPTDSRLASLFRQLSNDQIRHLPKTISDSNKLGKRQFFISDAEIDRGAYRRFLRDPLVWLGVYNHSDAPAENSLIPDNWSAQLRAPDRPVTGVDYWDASAFAKWANGRLPTEAEWNWVASLGGNGIYPYGDQYDPEAAAVSTTATGPVRNRSFVGDVNSVGVHDLAGNVSEWTSTPAKPRDGGTRARIVKGGNFRLDGVLFSRSIHNFPVPTGFASDAIGFRVVWDIQNNGSGEMLVDK